MIDRGVRTGAKRSMPVAIAGPCAQSYHQSIKPKNCKWYRLITSDIGLGLSSHPRQWLWLTIDSGYDLHWSLFCQKVLTEIVRTNFPSTFCKRTSFQTAHFNEYQFSLGPVFIEPRFEVRSFSIGRQKFSDCTTMSKSSVRVYKKKFSPAISSQPPNEWCR